MPAGICIVDYMRVFSEQEVAANLPSPREAIDLMRDTLLALSSGDASVTPKSQVAHASDENPGAFANAMPAAWPARNLLGLKWVTITPANTERDLPTIDATVLLNDATTGQPRAAMGGAALTGLRTAAVTGATIEGIAPDLPPVGFLGTGVQARSHAQVCQALGYEEMWVWGRREEALEELQRWAAQEVPSLRLHTTTDRSELLANTKVIISGLAFTATGQELDPAELPSDALLLPIDYGTVVNSTLAQHAAEHGVLAADDPEQYRALLPAKFPDHYPATHVATGSLFDQPLPEGLIVVQNLGSGLGDLAIADAVLRNIEGA